MRKIEITDRDGALVALLRAASDPARLALLRACAMRAQSVTDLAWVTGQAESAVSRQLKQLAEAGWLRRERRGQRVEYSLDSTSRFAELRAALLASLGVESTAGAGATRAAAGGDVGLQAAPDTRLSRERSGAIARLVGERPAGAVALVLSENAADFAPALLGQGARLLVGVPTVSARIATQSALRLRRLEAEVLLDGDLLRRVRAGDAAIVVLDGPTEGAAAWLATLARVRRLLAGDALLLVRCDYAALESLLPDRAPPLALQRLLQDAGLDCRQLLPVEADGRHELLACAALRSVVRMGEGARTAENERASR